MLITIIMYIASYKQRNVVRKNNTITTCINRAQLLNSEYMQPNDE
jgi:hypothetical protein